MSSGEQTAEIAVEDGAQHIPVGTTWDIACDKERDIGIGPRGGTIVLPWANSLAVVTFPPGALAADTVVTLQNALPIPNAAAVPGGFLPISEALLITSDPRDIPDDDIDFAVNVRVSLPYTDGEVEGYEEDSLQVLRFHRGLGTWQVIPSNLDTLNNRFNFTIDSFGVYGFAGPPTAHR